MDNGKVFLIGAGPGDIGLLTLKAKRCLSEADVVLYDYLVGEEIIAFAKVDAEIIYVGKKAGQHTLKQEEINQLLADKAKEGKMVARLKGGDPFLFGRGGEEALFLIEQGIAFEVVPGVTSAIAVPAYAGIPVTHRECASSLCIVTGHESIDKMNVPWENIAGIETIVILMGVANLKEIAQRLIESGKSSDTPVAAIHHGTTNRQKTVVTTLAEIRLDTSSIHAPAIIVVGQVVRLREQLNWFEDKPLFGKGIIVTRPILQKTENNPDDISIMRLQNLGAVVYKQPTIKILPLESFEEIDAAIKQILLRKYHWLIFTSVNGVAYFMQRLKVSGLDIRELSGIQIAAIGPQTKLEIEKYCLKVDYCPKEYVAEALVAGLKGYEMNGKHVLIPRAKEARAVLEDGLREQGAIPHPIAVYQTVSYKNERIQELLLERRVDVITLTSPSCVKGFCSIFEGEDMQPYLSGVKIACVGPITQRAAMELNLKTDIIAREYTMNGLVAAILEAF